MTFIALTRCVTGEKQLVNMGLVSEVIPVGGQRSWSNLVVPSATYEDARFIAVRETATEIAALLAEAY